MLCSIRSQWVSANLTSKYCLLYPAPGCLFSTISNQGSSTFEEATCMLHFYVGNAFVHKVKTYLHESVDIVCVNPTSVQLISL